jgi:hypothetical protein
MKHSYGDLTLIDTWKSLTFMKISSPLKQLGQFEPTLAWIILREPTPWVYSDDLADQLTYPPFFIIPDNFPTFGLCKLFYWNENCSCLSAWSLIFFLYQFSIFSNDGGHMFDGGWCDQPWPINISTVTKYRTYSKVNTKSCKGFIAVTLLGKW